MMRPSRIFRLVVRIFLLLLASSMSLVSFLGGYSAVLILTNEDNIDIDLDTTGEISPFANNFSLELKIEFHNQGYYDLEDLELELELNIVYLWINKTGNNDNVTTTETLFDYDKDLGTTLAGDVLKKKIEIEYEDLEVNMMALATRIDLNNPRIDFEAEEIKIKAKYSLGLLKFKVVLEDFDLGEYEEVA
ncbi:MAG: hypothetical protein ACFFAO_09915 [Candidatus Hermodarchaeota archaeon]